MSRSRSPLRVLVTGPSLEGRGAGIQQHMRTLIEGFCDSPEIEIVPYPVTSAQYLEPWLLKARRLLGVWAAFPRACRNTDVVHINSTIDRRSMIRDGVLACLAHLVHRPVVVQFHGGGAHRLHGIAGALSRASGRCFRHAHRVLFLSRTQGEPLKKTLRLEREEYVANYVNVGSFGIPARSGSRSLKVLYLGRLDAAKGVLEVLEAFAETPGREWELVIAGAGSLEAEIGAAVRDDARTSYRGFVGPQVRVELLRWADVLCLPSDHDEGLPYAVLEAAASGCALVTSAKGGLSSVVIDGVTGYHVGPRDASGVRSALVALDENRRLLAAMQSEAFDLVSRNNGIDMMRGVFTRVWRDAADDGGPG